MSIRAYRRPYSKPRNRATRPKTFKTEEAAKTYAEANKIKKYKIENVKSPEAKVKKLKLIIE